MNQSALKKPETNVLKERFNKQETNDNQDDMEVLIIDSPTTKKPVSSTASIRDFFAKSQTNQLNKEPVKKNKESEQIVNTALLAPVPALAKDILMKNGRLYSASNKSEQNDEEKKIQNHMFGSLIMIVELNNLLLNIYGPSKSKNNIPRFYHLLLD